MVNFRNGTRNKMAADETRNTELIVYRCSCITELWKSQLLSQSYIRQMKRGRRPSSFKHKLHICLRPAAKRTEGQHFSVLDEYIYPR